MKNISASLAAVAALVLCLGAGKAGPTSQPDAPLTVNNLFADAPALPKNRAWNKEESERWKQWLATAQIGKRITVRGRHSLRMHPDKIANPILSLLVAGPFQSGGILCRNAGVQLKNIDRKLLYYEEGMMLTMRGDIAWLDAMPMLQAGKPADPKLGPPFMVRIELTNVEFIAADRPADGMTDMR